MSWAGWPGRMVTRVGSTASAAGSLALALARSRGCAALVKTLQAAGAR